jgi:hypothetical protein
VTATAEVLKGPFPWPGGKARVADTVWARLGNIDNFVEPFAGSLAVLLRRPAEHFRDDYRVETVNDLNHFIVNAWRSIQRDPEQVAKWADSPVFEADLHARHKWLMRSQHAADYRRWMTEDPEHYDAKVAGWWIWGACAWIGSGWCDGIGTDWVQPQRRESVGVPSTPTEQHLSQQIPELMTGRGGHRGRKAEEPAAQIDDLSGGFGKGMGVNRAGRPQLADAFDIGRVVNGGGRIGSTQIPLISGPGDGVNSIAGRGTCAARRSWLIEWMQRLADRLRLVRTCYGSWERICSSDSTLTRLGTTGVFLDPPYPAKRGDTGEKSRDASLYATDNGADLDKLRDDVLAWCVKWGSDKNIRVAVCGYEGDGYELLVAEHGWDEHAWEASGGYGNQSKKGNGKATKATKATNAARERIWFSPACTNTTRTLFDDVE